jgi:predicted ATPase/DNA-binding XRE family transcriptional regulator
MTETGFGELLRRYRIAAGLTQEELAERAGVSTRGISDLERGARGLPRKDTLQMLLQALDLSPEDRAALVAAARPSPASAARQSRADGAPALPVSPTPLIGRESELEIARALMLRPEVRNLTLTGPGGIGKTRLGLQLAADLRDQFADGVYFVALAAVADPGLVASKIAQTLRVQEAPGRSLIAGIQADLKDKERLLLLDNFEHVVEAAHLVAELLAVCPAMKVLVTSRAPLHLRGEREFTVPPLALPDANRLPDVAALSQYAAVRLFTERAQDVKADFAVTNENAPAIAEICHRLDGLPLALELAAARVKILSPAALVTRLDQRLPLLTGGAQDLPDRQRTLRNTIAWSYDLLSPEDQLLFRRLAVFAGGWTLVAAEVVADPGGKLDALEGMSSLVDKSLVRTIDQSVGDPRFTMLETIREYALEQLAAGQEADDTRRCHAGHYLALVEELRPQIEGPNGPTALGQLEVEHPNLQAALTWATDRGDAETALRLVAGLWKFWRVHRHLAAGRSWTEQVVVLRGAVALVLQAEAYYAACTMALEQGDYPAAWQHGEKGLAVARQADAAFWIPALLFNLGNVARNRGDPDQAAVLYEEALPLMRQLGVQNPLAHHFEAMILASLGAVGHTRGRYNEAAALTEAALAIWRDRGDAWGQGIASLNQAAIALARGNAALAAALYRDAIDRHRTVGDASAVAEALGGLARTAAIMGRPQEAARLFGVASALRSPAGVPGAGIIVDDHEAASAAVRSAVGEEEFIAALIVGTALPLEEAVAEALVIAEELTSGQN